MGVSNKKIVDTHDLNECYFYLLEGKTVKWVALDIDRSCGLYRIHNSIYLELELTTLLILTAAMAITNYFNDNYRIIK